MSTEHRTSEVCATIPPLPDHETYNLKGTTKSIDVTVDGQTTKLDYYETIPDQITKPDFAVIQYYDVIGPDSKKTKIQADRVAAGLGCKVVGPDYFQDGGGFPGFTSQEGEARHTKWKTELKEIAFYPWLNQFGAVDKSVTLTKAIQEKLKSEGITKFAVIGHCWGAINGIEFAKRTDLNLVGSGLIHGRSLKAEDASALKVPVANFPSQGEGQPQSEFHDHQPSSDALKKSIFKYWDEPHGFSSGRGDWSIPTRKQHAQEVIEDYVNWVDGLLRQ